MIKVSKSHNCEKSSRLLAGKWKPTQVGSEIPLLDTTAKVFKFERFAIDEKMNSISPRIASTSNEQAILSL